MLEQLLTIQFLSQMAQTIRPLIQIRLIYLENITGADYLGALACAGYNRLYLQRSKILGFIYYKIAFSKTSAANISQRLYQQLLLLKQAVYLEGLARCRLELSLYHIQIVHERLQERPHFSLGVTRKEADILIAENYCGA